MFQFVLWYSLCLRETLSSFVLWHSVDELLCIIYAWLCHVRTPLGLPECALLRCHLPWLHMSFDSKIPRASVLDSRFLQRLRKP